MRVAFIFIIFLFAGIPLSAQNMVPNPGFEDTIAGAPCYGPIEELQNWFNPNLATPDYYTFFPNYCGSISTPDIPIGYQQARSGNAFAGIYGYISQNREYVAVTLTDTLNAGECYYAEFYCSLANFSRYSIDRLGMYFTDDTTGMKLYATNIPATPQVLNTFGNFLSDTLNWMHVGDTFTASGGETFVIIGNFFDHQNTPVDTVSPQSTWTAAYYYIDDVRVISCDSVSALHDISVGTTLVFPNPAADFLNVYSENNLIAYKSFIVYDVNGKALNHEVPVIESNHISLKLDIKNLPEGIYNIVLYDFKNRFSSHRFVKLNF